MNIKQLLSIVSLAALSVTASAQDKLNGFNLNNLNTQVAPGDDFFEYACGGWNKANPLTAEYSRYGAFEVLFENNNKQLQALINDLAAGQYKEGSLEQKIGTLYHIAMDSVKQNKLGYTPIKADLKAINATRSKKALWKLVSENKAKGIPTMFDFYLNADDKNSTMNIMNVCQAGLTMGEREYYLENDSATAAIREAYKKFLQQMFVMTGSSQDQAEAKEKAVMDIETRIAQVSLSATERRDPEKNYHKMSYAGLCSQFAGIDWNTLFAAQGMKGIREVNMCQIAPLHEVEKIWAECSLAQLQAYAEWKFINSASGYLSDELRTARFDFFGRTMHGRQQESPRWKRAVETVNGVMGEALGRLYTEHYFPAAAKERMVTLVRNLQKSLGERIEAQPWMSEGTKKKALEKLSTFIIKVGYPDKWRSYDALVIKDDSYWANIVRSNLFDLAYEVEHKLNKPVDRSDWYMTPQTVNAYYNPSTNEICFPAGILQPPFFDMNADDATNYGAIGVVIGHEMTHGFDDNGRRYDKDGNLRSWWDEQDVERFNSIAQGMRSFFDNIEVLPGLKANGSLTLGENLADHGGLMVAYNAFMNNLDSHPLPVKEGFTPQQRFFLAYGLLWAGNIREEAIRSLTKSDPHSLGLWRVNGALPHIDAWYKAFDVKPTHKLYLPEDKRVRIW